VDFGTLKEAERVNKGPDDMFLEEIRRALRLVNDKRQGLLGLAFKPDTDDSRFAPSLEDIRRLLAEDRNVCACDPEAMSSPSGRSFVGSTGSASMD
jgi:UDPglucose 6-dehydrogenase